MALAAGSRQKQPDARSPKADAGDAPRCFQYFCGGLPNGFLGLLDQCLGTVLRRLSGRGIDPDLELLAMATSVILAWAASSWPFSVEAGDAAFAAAAVMLTEARATSRRRFIGNPALLEAASMRSLKPGHKTRP